MAFHWQPTLVGQRIVTEPLQEGHFDALFAAASDPEIWALHPVRDRYTRPKFEIFFHTGLASQGALLVRDALTREVIGSSRFTSHDPKARSVEIGYTFLRRSHWGTGANRELKRLMLSHAFQVVDLVEFFIGVDNLRSRGAIEKIGARLLREVKEREPEGDVRHSVVYGLRKEDPLP